MRALTLHPHWAHAVANLGKRIENRGRAIPGVLVGQRIAMLNPSTADGLVDAPTIRRCVGFAKAAGMDGIEVVNLFPWRATKPADLMAAHCVGHDVASTEQRDHHIREALAAAAFPIAAWGAHPMAARQAQSVLRLSDVWFVLGLTQDGHPRHPLYLPNAAEPVIVDRHDLVRP